MVRLIVREAQTIPDGACVGNTYRTFDIDAPELEKAIGGSRDAYTVVTVIGAEVLK